METSGRLRQHAGSFDWKLPFGIFGLGSSLEILKILRLEDNWPAASAGWNLRLESFVWKRQADAVPKLTFIFHFHVTSKWKMWAKLLIAGAFEYAHDSSARSVEPMGTFAPCVLYVIE